MSFKSKIKNMLYNLKYFIQKKYIELYYHDYIIFQSLSSIGDIFMLCTSLKAFKEKYNKKVLILYPKYCKHVDLFRQFKEIDVLKAINNRLWEYILLNTKFELKNPPVTGRIYALGASFDKTVLVETYTECFKKFVFMQNDDYSLNIPDLKISKEGMNKINNIFTSYSIIPSKTVFIAPYSVTLDYDTVDISFWQKLAARFSEEGFDVIVNTSSKDDNFSDFKKIFLSITEQIIFASKCNSVVSARTGFSELLGAYLNNKLIIVYPPGINDKFSNLDIYKKNVKDLHEYNKEEVLFKYWSLISAFGKKNITEMIYSDNTNIDYILNIVKK